MKKEEIKERLDVYFEEDTFCGPLEEVSRKIANYLVDHKEQLEQVDMTKYHRVEIDYDWGYDNDKVYDLYGYRYKNKKDKDEEEKKRKEQEKRDREYFERLKKKLGL